MSLNGTPSANASASAHNNDGVVVPGVVDVYASPQAATRRALLMAAGEVFAERGFRHATVREICLRAGANVAAVNYHFQDKETLYLEVLRFAHRQAAAVYPVDGSTPVSGTAEQRLRHFIGSLLGRLMDAGPLSWQGKLLAQEMIEPTAALDTLVEERFRPMANYLCGVLRELVGSEVAEEKLWLCGCSIVSQCFFYHHCRAVLCRLSPERRFDEAEILRLTDHITELSLGALRAVTAGGSSTAGVDVLDYEKHS